MDRVDIKIERAWLGFISSVIVDGCIQQNKQNCPACKDGMKSPILHFHNALNLHDIIEKYFAIVIRTIDMKALFEKFEAKMSVYGKYSEFITSYNNSELITTGQFFLKTLNPKALYYGDYITPDIDSLVSITDSNINLEAGIVPPVAYNPESPSYEPTPVKKQLKKTKEDKMDVQSVVSDSAPKRKIAKKESKNYKRRTTSE